MCHTSCYIDLRSWPLKDGVMSTTTIRLPEDLKARVASAAEHGRCHGARLHPRGHCRQDIAGRSPRCVRARRARAPWRIRGQRHGDPLGRGAPVPARSCRGQEGRPPQGAQDRQLRPRGQHHACSASPARSRPNPRFPDRARRGGCRRTRGRHRGRARCADTQPHDRPPGGSDPFASLSSDADRAGTWRCDRYAADDDAVHVVGVRGQREAGFSSV